MALLATFVGDQNSDTWGDCSNEESKWALGWAAKLQPFLPSHRGSRQARGLAPTRTPVMLFGSMAPICSEEEPSPSVHGDVPGATLNRVIELPDRAVCSFGSVGWRVGGGAS